MSHFTVTVVVPAAEATGAPQIHAWVNKVLAPFDEDLRVWDEATDEIIGEDVSHWDWYCIGGRWTGYFKPRPGAPFMLGESGAFDNPPKPGGADIIRKDDVDWEGMVHENAERARAYYRSDDYAKWDRGPAMTEQEYVNSRSSFATHAVVDKEGQWHQKGDMGWFGIVVDESEPQAWGRAYAEFIGSANDGDVLVLVDCHV